MNLKRIFLICLTILFCTKGVWAEPLRSKQISRVELLKRDLGELPGYEYRLYEISYPPGAKAPRHAHPVVGQGYVLSGCIESQFAGEPLKRIQKGDAFLDLAGIVHQVSRNCSKTSPLKFLVSYIVRKNQSVFVPK